MGGRGSNFGGGGDFTKQLLGQGGGTGQLQPLDISKMGNMTVQQAEERARSKNHEELFIFDENDKLVAAYKGNANSVAFPSSELSRQAATVTHGHPVGTSDFGGTLSFTDVGNMLRSNWQEHRATARGQGEMNYIMRRTGKSDSQGLMNQMLKDAPKVESSFKSEYKRTYDSLKAAGRSEAQARHEARQKAVGQINRYYKNTMPKYGFEYITRKKGYDYNR